MSDLSNATEMRTMMVKAVDRHLKKTSGGNYTLADWIEDFDGTDEELTIDFIKLAADIL